MRGSTRRRLARLLVGIVTISLLTAPTSAQAAETPVIQGTITDLDTRQPVAGACVALLSTPLAVDHETCTDSLGRYVFHSPVTFNRYWVRVRATGYAERWYPRGGDFGSGAFVYPDTTNPTRADLAITRYAGTLRGRVFRQDGSPAAMVELRAHRVGGLSPDNVVSARATMDGHYRFSNLPQGSYQISVVGDGYPGQWFPGAASQSTAGTYQVTAGGEIVLDERFRAVEPMPVASRGTLTGLVRDAATGAGLPGVCLTVYEFPWFLATETCTDGTGRYRTALRPNLGSGYRVVLQRPGSAPVWAPSSATVDGSALYQLAIGQTATADVLVGDGPHAGASVAGRIIDYTGGPPVDPVSVYAQAITAGWQVTVPVAADGSYRLPRLPAGDYRFSARVERPTTGGSRANVTQWFPQRYTAAEAEKVSLGDGQNVTRDEVLRAPAALELTVLDDTTGAPMTDICMAANGDVRCNATDGKYHFPWLWYRTVDAKTEGVEPEYFGQQLTGLPVVAGETTRRTVRLKPGAVLRTRIVERSDGSPVRNSCIYAVSAAPAGQLPGPAVAHCSDNLGEVAIGPLPATAVHLFAAGALSASSRTLGAQWVGATGGTGDRREAVVFQGTVGVDTTIAEIRLDRAGTVTGTITDQATGAPLAGCVEVYGGHPDLLGADGSTCAGPDGRYIFVDLGPYRWPLRFFGRNTGTYAATWSGPATDRYTATLIQVTADSTRQYDMALGPEGKIPLTVTNAPTQWTAQAYHPTTGDLLATATPEQPHLGGLNTGPVYIRYTTGTGSCWYTRTVTTGPLRRIVRTHTVQVTAGQTTTPVTITPGTTCTTSTPRFGTVTATSGTAGTARTAPAVTRRQTSHLAR
ncbi:carboxypeptidase-like regulatory domain-containing protein [Micromonospora echinofusca]|uniref:Alpha-amylase n=1 Tax=Micromonospora echinofusca TaxID=47858 RepID=A0ABS3VJI9_MICEH|nr:carboxypeptidase-like regulatory domain-containing protein [Micromonospora echinofusca]MBO4204643.1 hypothetical protein [Micromonospora echinofusca]